MEEALLQNSTKPIQSEYTTVNEATTDTLDNDIKKDVDELKAEEKLKTKAVESKIKPLNTKEGIHSFSTQIIDLFAKPSETSELGTEEEEWEKNKNKFLKDFKTEVEAKKEFSKSYEYMSKYYDELAKKEQSFSIIKGMKSATFGLIDVNYIGEDYSPDLGAVPSTVSGRKILMDSWTDRTKSPDKVALESKKVIDYKGDIIEVENDPYADLAYESKYADKDGNNIVAFQAVAGSDYSRENDSFMKAVYEGELVEGPVISWWDAKDIPFLSNNDLDSTIMQSLGSGVINFLLGTADAVVTLAKYNNIILTANGLLSPTFEEEFDTASTVLSTFQMSKSTRDQENMFTANNFITFGVDIALQLFTARIVASAGARILGLGAEAMEGIVNAQKAVNKAGKAVKLAKTTSKIAAAEKELASAKKGLKILEKLYDKRSNKVKWFTRITMGAMQAKETGKAAKHAGFTPLEQAAIYFGTLGLMSYVNGLSDLGFEKAGLNRMSQGIKLGVEDSYRGVSKAGGATVKSMIGKGYDVTKSAIQKTKSIVARAPLASNTIQEGFEEVAEFIADEVVRHTATYAAAFGYSEDDTPKFMTAFDKGYSDYFFEQVAFNFVGGAVGGAFAGIGPQFKKSFGSKKTAERLNIKGDTAEMMDRVAHASTRTDAGVEAEGQFLQMAKEEYEQGYGGRHDISTKWYDGKGRYKRMNELTEEEKKKYISQAQMQYEALIGYYFHLKHAYANDDRTIDEIVKQKPQFGVLRSDEALFNSTRRLLSEKAEIYETLDKTGTIELDSKIEELIKLKEKSDEYKTEQAITQKPAEKGANPTTKYNNKLTELSNASKLSAVQIEQLISIESDLNDINSGKILEEAYYNRLLQDKKYKGLDVGTLKALILAADKAKVEYEEKSKNELTAQVATTAEINTILTSGKEPREVIADIVNTYGKDGIAFLDPAVKQKIRGISAGLGVSFEEHKHTTIKKLLDDLDTITPKSKTEENKSLFEDKLQIEHLQETLLTHGTDAFSVELEKIAGSMADPDILGNIYDFILTNASGEYRTDVRNAEEIDDYDSYKEMHAKLKKQNPELLEQTLRTKYILEKLYDVSKTQMLPDLQNIKYDLQSVKYNDTQQVKDFFDEQFSFLSTYGNKQEAIEFDKSDTALVGSFLEDDPEFKLKSNINSILNVARVASDPKDINHFTAAFSKNAAGSIEVEATDLLEKYSTLVSTAPKDSKTGKIQYFNDKKAADDFFEMVDIREKQVMFILEYLYTIKDIHQINKQFFGKNISKDKTFLSTFVNKNLVDLEHLHTGKIGDAYAELFSTSRLLGHLKIKAEELQELANNGKENLSDIYIKQSVKSAKKKLTAVKKVFLDEEVKKLVVDLGIKTSDENDLSEEVIELNAILDTINTLDFDVITETNVKLIYETVDRAYKVLGSISSKNNKFLDAIEASMNTSFISGEYFTDVTLMFFSPIDNIYSILRDTYLDKFEKAKDDTEKLNALKLPTMDQIDWIESATTAALNPKYIEYLGKRNNPRAKELYKYIMIFDGDLGTGKSDIIAGVTGEVIQTILRKSDNESVRNRKILYASNYESTVDDLVASSPNVEKAQLLYPGEKMTQDLLWKTLVDTDDDIGSLVLAFDGISTIIYDEISYVEFDPSSEGIEKSRANDTIKEAGTLNGILAKIEQINKYRDIPLVILGLGSSTQGGHMIGMSTPRNSKVSDKLDKGSSNIFTLKANEVIVRHGVKLKHNFRAKIAELKSGIEDIYKALMVQSFTDENHNLPTISTIYEINKDTKKMSGIQISRDWVTNVLNNQSIVDAIAQEIADDPNFTVLIISGNAEYDGGGLMDESTLLGKFKAEHEKNFKTQSLQDATFKEFSMHNVQGKQADYALINMPDNYLNLSMEQKNNNDVGTEANEALYSDKVNRITMAIGRASKYSHLMFTGDFSNISSIDGTTTSVSPSENAAFKETWGKFLFNSIFYDRGEVTNYEPIVEEDTRTEEEKEAHFKTILADLQIKEGSVIYVSNNQHVVTEILKTSVKTMYNGVENIIDMSSFENGEVLTEEAYKLKNNQKPTSELITKAKEIKAAEISKKNNTPIVKVSEKNSGNAITYETSEEEVTNIVSIEKLNEKLAAILAEYNLKNTEVTTKDIILIINNINAKLLKANASDTVKLENKKYFLLNYNDILLGNLNNELEPIDESDEDYLTESDESKEILKKAEKDNLAATYSHVGSNNLEFNQYNKRFSSESSRAFFLKKVYPNETYENDDHTITRGLLLDALGLGANGKDSMDGFSYDLVSYMDMNTMEIMHVIVATIKEGNSKGKKLLLTKFGPADMYDPIGDIARFLGTRANDLLQESDDSSTILGESRAIVSHIHEPKVLFQGTTVGSLITGNKSIQDAAATQANIIAISPKVASLDPGKFIKGAFVHSQTINILQKLTEDINNSSDRVKALEEFLHSQNNTLLVGKTSGKSVNFFQKIGNIVVTYVNTTRGVIPYGFIDDMWQPLMGVTSDGVIVHDEDTIIKKEGNKEYDAELTGISNKLKSLVTITELTDNNLIADSKEKEVIRNINNSLVLSPELRKETSRLKFIDTFNKTADRYFGNLPLPLPVAEKLMDITGAPSSVSKVYNFTSGKNRGKAVVLYTFRKDIDLSTMSPTEINDLYKRMLKEKNANDSELSNNRLGIGQILLDVEGHTLSELGDFINSIDGVNMASDTLNKVILNGKAEKSLIKLFAAMQYVFNNEDFNSNIVLSQLLNTEEDTSIIEAAELIKAKANKTDTDYIVSMLSTMFSSENLGDVVTAASNTTFAALVSNVEALQKAYDGLKRTPKLEAEYREELEKIYASLNPKLQNEFSIETIADLQNIVVRDRNSIGYLVLDDEGKAVVYNSENGIISAVNRDLITKLQSEEAVPDAKFDIVKFFRELAKNTNTEEIKSMYEAIQVGLDVMPEFRKGIFMSTSFKATNSPLALAENIPIKNGHQAITTTVKQVKMPALIINIPALSDNNIIDLTAQTRKTQEEEDERLQSQRIAQQLSARIERTTGVVSLTKTLDIVEKNKELIPLDKTKLTNLIERKIVSIISKNIKNAKYVNDIKLSDYFNEKQTMEEATKIWTLLSVMSSFNDFNKYFMTDGNPTKFFDGIDGMILDTIINNINASQFSNQINLLSRSIEELSKKEDGLPTINTIIPNTLYEAATKSIYPVDLESFSNPSSRVDMVLLAYKADNDDIIDKLKGDPGVRTRNTKIHEAFLESFKKMVENPETYVNKDLQNDPDYHNALLYELVTILNTANQNPNIIKDLSNLAKKYKTSLKEFYYNKSSISIVENLIIPLLTTQLPPALSSGAAIDAKTLMNHMITAIETQNMDVDVAETIVTDEGFNIDSFIQSIIEHKSVQTIMSRSENADLVDTYTDLLKTMYTDAENTFKKYVAIINNDDAVTSKTSVAINAFIMSIDDKSSIGKLLKLNTDVTKELKKDKKFKCNF